MSLQESNLNSNYVCSPVGKHSGHPGVLSSGNMASTPSFQILTDAIDPGLAPVPTGLRCVNYVGPQFLGRTQMVAVEHRLGEWQSNQTSSPDLVHNDRCIQDRMGCGLPRASHKWALVGRRKQTSHKRIRTQGRLLGPKVLPKESVSSRGLPENGQH